MRYQFRLPGGPFESYSEFGNAEEGWTSDFAQEWQGEVSGKIKDNYIYWVQESLNKIQGSRLALDGDIGGSGSSTRKAVNAFQRAKGLPVSTSGSICPDTERALIVAGANPPPGKVSSQVARASETTPPALTIYVDIPLQIRLGSAKSMTGIFVPENYCTLPQVDLIVYLPGHKLRSHKPEHSIDSYWGLPRFRLREEVNGSQRNVLLVAPTLGPTSESGSLTCPGGFDRFLEQVTTALKQLGPYVGTPNTPSIRNIILACHSGGAKVMREIATGSDTSAAKIQECWAFDPFRIGDPLGWKNWAQAHPTAKLYIYYRSGNPGYDLCKSLMSGNGPKRCKVNCLPNVVAELTVEEHDDLPSAYLKERIQGAPFLVGKSNCPTNPTSQRKSPIPIRPLFRGARSGLSRESDELVGLWDSDEAEKVWPEEVRRSSPAYVRWVQESMNKTSRLRLPEDGIARRKTRSAIRSFEHRHGLKSHPDGIVSAQTERALIAAGANPPPRIVRHSVGGLEFEGPQTVLRPAPNFVDAEAAEPIFSRSVRAPEAPLLHPTPLKLSSQWNQATHPRVSGITLAELRVRLERYLDRAKLEDLMRQANANTASSYGSDEATLVTLLAHQFQRKTCRAPTVGDIAKPCTMNGRVAEDTLDALGFVYHAGRALNEADRSNSVAVTILRRLPATAFAEVEPGLKAGTWWSYMVSPPWLGLPIKQGIHIVLLKRLRHAQRALMDLPAYAGLSAADLGRALGLEEEHKGARPNSADMSMHLFGLAIDISYTRNPWLSNPQRNTARIAEITRRATRLVGSLGAVDQGITARYLDGLANTHRDTAKIHKILADSSRWLGEYFALAGDAGRLESLLVSANVIYPDGDWFKRDESLAEGVRRWMQVILADFDAFAVAVSRGGNKNEVRQGFMDLARDLVIALRDDACLGWGAVDFGPGVSGDVMHFDCRIEGIGRTIARTSGRPYVPNAGHLCLPAGRMPTEV